MIYGERVRLRRIERVDIPKYYEWINDPEVLEGLGANLPMSMTDEEKWFDETTQREQAKKPFAIEIREQDSFTGDVVSPTFPTGDNLRTPGTLVPAIELAPSAGATPGGWRLIGNCAFFDIDWISRAAEFGIMVGDKSVWNQGYGTETVRLLLRHGFENLNLNRVFLRVFDNNPRAIRAYEKAGFTLEGTQRQAAYQYGAYHDVHMMSVLRTEWEKSSR